MIELLNDYANDPINFESICDVIRIKDIKSYKKRLLEYYLLDPMIRIFNSSFMTFSDHMKFDCNIYNFKRYFDMWFFHKLSSNPNLSPKNIDKYIDFLDYSKLLRNPALTSDLIGKYFPIKRLSGKYVKHLLYNSNFTEDMIEEYTDRLLKNNHGCRHINDIVCYKCINPDNINIEEYFMMLCNAHNLTPRLIEKYIDYIDFEYFNTYDKFTPELLEEYEDQLIYHILSRSNSITPELIHRYFYDLAEYDLSSNPSLTEEIIDEYFDDLINPDLLKNKAFTVNLIEKYIDRLDLDDLSHNPNLTLELIEKYYVNTESLKYIDSSRFIKLSKDTELNIIISEFMSRGKLDLEDIYRDYYDRIYNIHYKQKYNKTMIELSYCPYFKGNSNYKHHYHQGTITYNH